MQLKSDPHIFSGMQRDMAISKHKAESLWDAHNIRFTARDGDTLLSITNEKGTLQLNNISMEGIYLGHCVINNYVIVFTHSNNNQQPDYIYKITPSLDGNDAITILYNGNLNFSIEHSIETLGIYENDKIQKVYWTDGYNQPRYIFTGDYPETRVTANNDTQFDFVATLDLNEDVSVTRKEGSGYFAPGTIQYAFTYYNKYGRQSNIFYTTLLYYISYPDRGGSPEDKISVCFEITVDNLQVDDFDYLRVYSIHRTSENAIPTVKRVIDVELSTVRNNTTTFTDDGDIGDTIDPTELLYMGGEIITTQSMTQKDNTLFFGNLEIKRESIDENLKDYLCAIDRTTLEGKDVSDLNINVTEFAKSYQLEKQDSSNGYYNYVNTLDWSSPGFKINEHYRLGVQFQHETGKWSEPVFIGDYTMDGVDSHGNTISPRVFPNLVDNNNGTYELQEPCLSLIMDLSGQITVDGVTKTWLQWLTDSKYKKVRPIVVLPSFSDRLVLTQGMLCPTVFNLKARRTATPFSQSSWFLRPFLPYPADDSINSKKTVDGGNWAEFRHFRGLGADDSFNCEVQGNTIIRMPTLATNYSEEQERKAFFVDQSILTFHSPDIEWDNTFYSLNYTNWKLRLAGIINFTANVGDIDIQTSSPANKKGKGFIHNNYGVSNRSKYAAKSLISGPFWNDYIVGTEIDDDTDLTKYILSKYPVNYIVYPWHRGGSLNNDETRESDNGTRTAVLSKKKLSNLKFSDFTTYFDNTLTYDISPIQLFSSDQVSVLKIPYANTVLGNISYCGNVDTLVSTNINKFKWMQDIDLSMRDLDENDPALPDIDGTGGKDPEYITEGSAPVRIKYKSTKHLTFSLKLRENELGIRILPTLNGLNSRFGNLNGELDTSSIFWSRYQVPEGDLTYNTYNLVKAIINKPDDYDNIWESLSVNDLVIKENAGGTLTLHRITSIISSNVHYVVTEDVSTVENGNPKKYWYNIGTNIIFYEGVVGATNQLVETQPSYTYQEVTQFANILQDNINYVPEYPYLFLGELYRDDNDSLNAFNGKSDDAVKSNLWIPAGEPIKLSAAVNNSLTVQFTQGDTWYTRYDCLKTYPFTMEDENSIVEIGSFLCESRVNADGRYDRNRGQISNLMMSPTNFNLLNPVYNNHDNFFNYRILDDDYYTLNKFSNQITWSKEKQMASDVDTWTNVTLANTFDLDGTMGPINSLQTWSDTIYCFQNKAISIISFNPRVQIPVTDGVPIEISNSGKLEGKIYISTNIGCENKQTIAVTPSGIYFVDPNSRELYNVAGKELKDISTSHGFNDWFKNTEIDKTFYDSNRNDLYVVNSTECLTYSEILGQFTSFMDYNGTPAMFNIKDKFFAFRNEDYVNNNVRYGKVSMYELFAGDYNTFFKQTSVPFWIEFVSNADAALDKIFSTIELRLDYFNKNKTVSDNITSFDKIRIYNEYQDTSIKTISWDRVVPSSIKRKFRIWRINIPRDRTNKLDRIRNTWAKILLRQSNPGNKKMVLHDLSVQYFV